MYWMAIGLAGGSLLTSTTILYYVLKVLRSTHRAERVGDERLQILGEQQQRLGFLREEKSVARVAHAGGGVAVAALDDGG